MSNPETLGVSLEYLRRLLRLGARPAREMAADGTLVRLARGRYDLFESVGRYAERIRAVAAGRGGEAAQLDLSRERARLAKEQADQVAFKNAQVRGELVRADEVERQWAEDYRSVQAHLLALPTKVGARLGLDRRQISLVDDLVRDALNEAADSVTADAQAAVAAGKAAGG